MKKGFYQAVKAADGPRTRYFNKDEDACTFSEGDILELSKKLKEEEDELRQLREERLRVESLVDSEAGGATDAVAQKSMPSSRLPPPLLETAYEALGSHEEPVPKSLHCLGEALMLLLESETLANDLPLPGNIPWKNLQQLLRNNRSALSPKAISTALASEPHGPRLRWGIRDRLCQGDQPLSREDVEKADPECVCIFDFVNAFVGDVPGEGGIRLVDPSLAPEKSDADALREKAAAAVRAKEAEVSELRKTLRKAKAVQDQRATTSDEQEAKREGQTSQAKKEALKLQEEEKEAKRESVASKSVAPSFSQVVEYYLGASDVLEIHFTVLHAMLKAFEEHHLASQRVIELTGFSEVREEDEVANERAVKIREWLVEHGAPESQIIIAQARPNERRGSRRTELKLIDRSDRAHDAAHGTVKVPWDIESIRSRSQDLISAVVTEGADIAHVPSQDVKEKQLKASLPNDIDSPTLETKEISSELLPGGPQVLVEEEEVEAGHPRRLRLVFSSPTLEASDAALELGERAVKLSSASNAWLEVEAALPFAVDTESATAPKFSKKRGTLTLCVSEVVS